MKRSVSDFFAEDLPAYSAYDNGRKICSYIDGMKFSMRKIIFTLLEKYAKNEFVKTETLANITAATTQYLHGATNLCIACNTMAQSFVGANNNPIITGNTGGFGTRINPTCAAPRYTRIKLSDITRILLNEDDVLISQIFEGTNIEPRFFVPIFPIIFLNGSNGLSTGFKQCILPRNPKDIINYIKSVITGKKYRSEFLPFYSGFKGIFTYVTEESGEKVLECHGLVKQINSTNYIIEELPIGIDYTKYIEILEKLVEAGVIQDYIDKCNPKDDSICFEIKTTREFTNNHKNKRDVLEAFKLIRSCPEQYNCIDENNRVREFKSVKEILDAYIKIRLEYYEKRKENLLKNLKFEVNKAYSKYLFIKGVNNETISIRKQPKEKIVKQLTKIDKIIQIENSYDYLFSIPIYSITLEKVEELKAFITKKKEEYEAIKKQTIEEMWLHDLENFQSFIKNK